MKKFSVLFASLILVVAMAAVAMATPVPGGTLLTVNAGLVTGGGEGDLVSGSGFAMGDGIHGTPPGDGSAVDGWTALLPGTAGGFIVGSSQAKKAIVAQWTYYNSPGNNLTTSPVYADTSGALAFSGWTVNWGGGPIPMGSTTDYTFTVTSPSTYKIDGAHVVSHPTDANFTFNHVVYTLRITGNIIPALPVPEPASLLLIGTGLVGLVGLARRKMK